MIRVSTCNVTDNGIFEDIICEDIPFILKKINFPDNTQKIDFIEPIEKADTYLVTWRYESDEELAELIFITRHLKDRFSSEVILNMPYIPNARFDRTKSNTEVFTLKYFADVINWLGFKAVYVFDPHSNVSPAIINHVHVISPEGVIREAMDRARPDYIYFPDEGAYKRYGSMTCFKDKAVLIGHKERDWVTGIIKGLRITNQDGMGYEYNYFRGKRVMMIDDIISYGGTLAYSADELQRLGFDQITAYASHVENSVLDEEKGTLLNRLKDGVVYKIYTTNSIYSGISNYIDIIKRF